jgi:tetratricopeptide (TPR) repeat protein
VGIMAEVQPVVSAPVFGRVFRRWAVLSVVFVFAAVTAAAVVRPYFFDAPPGDYQVRQGDILLGDGEYEAAIERFDAALKVSPDHRGALMGKAIAYLQSSRSAEAEAVFTHLIETLRRTLAADDPTGRGVLAGAYANRGILHDRQGRHEAALADYRQALAIDAGAVEGPGVAHRILYGNAQPSTVRKRADYLQSQLALPEAKRLLRVPELDAAQRMHKP